MSDEKSGVAGVAENKSVDNSVVTQALAILGAAGTSNWLPANPLAFKQSGVKHGTERQRNATITRQV